MRPTLDEVLDWKPAVLDTVANGLTRIRTSLLGIQDEIDAGGLPAEWFGVAAAAARANHRLLTAELNDRVAEVAAALKAVDVGAEATRRAKTLVHTALSCAQQLGYAVDPAAGSVTDTRTAPADEHEKADRQRVAQEIADQLEQALRAAAHADAELEQVLAALIVGVDGGPGSLEDAAGLGALAGSRDLLSPPRGGSPGDHAAWWGSLTDAEQVVVIVGHPRWIGTTEGIPAWARHAANVGLIPICKDELEQRIAELGGSPPAGDLAMFRIWKGKHDVLQGKLDGIRAIELLLARNETGSDYERQLLHLDLTGERRLEAAIGIGDLDDADHVTVFTPGLDSDLHDSLVANDQRMVDLVKRAERFGEANGSDDTYAGVFWLGYEAPQPGETTAPYRSVANDELAKDGAPDLARFLTGIDVMRDEDPHLTAIGHSYGSLVTGLALRSSTGVDDVILMGSPGPGTDDMRDLDVDGRSYYLEADWDPVGDLARFGSDPSGMAGIDTLSTDRAHSELLDQELARITGHTSYFEDGSTSQYNAAAIMSGHHHEVIDAPETEPNPLHRGWEWTGDRVDDGRGWVDDRVEDGREWAGDLAEDGEQWLGDRVEDGEQLVEGGGAAAKNAWERWGLG